MLGRSLLSIRRHVLALVKMPESGCRTSCAIDAVSIRRLVAVSARLCRLAGTMARSNRRVTLVGLTTFRTGFAWVSIGGSLEEDCIEGFRGPQLRFFPGR